MKQELNNIILKAISEALSLSLDDYEDEEISSLKTGKIEDINSKAAFLKNTANMDISLKVFVYELLKRLPKADKKYFSNSAFGFVNYKVTGNQNDWPYLISLNKKMANRIKERYLEIFDTKGWTTVSGSTVFLNLLLIEKDNRKLGHFSTAIAGTNLSGRELLNDLTKYNKTWIEDSFHGKYKECLDAIEKLIQVHPQLDNYGALYWMDQISFSNDGAFYAIMYSSYENHNSINHVEIFSTPNIVNDETGINLDEQKEVIAKQKLFKKFLDNNIVYNEKIPADLKPGIILDHACFKYQAPSSSEFDFMVKDYFKLNHAVEFFSNNIQYKYGNFDTLFFIRMSVKKSLYIVEREDTYGLYDKLRIESKKPYALGASEDGTYLVAFYETGKHYYSKNTFNTVTYLIIDNRDFEIMPKEYLKTIEYNAN